ncbi:MAG: translation elongation factor Ts [Planctomycetota bacterium]|nr:translation elongation factor Ts [Planctomycetota bacterium]MEC8733758.1 translation elongation factor Ts [Planctomycetota bacterium]MEC9157297.1 translation elongation factor Ts [Planctomycetota bacterium]MED5508603.1 translation elongation factor Ts [Planctomycetota bacterium]
MSTANISAKDVMALRQKTGLGMMDCKKALVEAEGDLAAAETALRAKLKGKMDERTDRAAGEGCIAIQEGGERAAILEVRAETDFTARNEMFVKMANDAATMALEQAPGEVEFTQPMTDALDNVRITTGENISFARGTVVEGSHFGRYVHHDGKLGVLVVFDGDPTPEVALGIAQHVAAHVPTPMAVDETGVPPHLIEARRNEAVQEARDLGKPDEIAAKIAEGKMRKFFEEVTLVGQKYVRDDSMQVGSILPDGVKVTHFIRMRVGEGDSSE